MMCVWLTATVLSQSIVREPGNGQRDHHKLQAYPFGARMDAEQIDLGEVDGIRWQLARLLQGGHALAGEHYREHHLDGGVDAEKSCKGRRTLSRNISQASTNSNIAAVTMPATSALWPVSPACSQRAS